MNAAAVLALAEAAEAVARAARALAADTGDPADLLPLRQAACVAATSVRVLRDAIRAGDLTAFGRQRDRAVRRADLNQWVADRRFAPVRGPDDRDIDRRVARLARRRGSP